MSHAVVKGQAGQRLHQRFSVGRLVGGDLHLAPVEAHWLSTTNRLDADIPMPPPAPSHEAIVYADLRERGLVVRCGDGFEIVARGGTAKDATSYRVQATSERDVGDAQATLDHAEAGWVLGVVDDDGLVTYYGLDIPEPRGEAPPTNLPVATGVVDVDRVVVADPVAAKAYREREWIGTPSPRGLMLSFTEAEALRRRGVLQMPGSLAAAAQARQPDFALTLPTYEALRSLGVVVKAGFRFGTHIRAYRSNPDDDHAEWLVHCVDAKQGLDWVHVARGVRLAHGVRKQFLLALVGEGVRFVRFTWFRP